MQFILVPMSYLTLPIREFRDRYLELISQGYAEDVALKKLDFPRAAYIRLILEDSDFARDVEMARKLRADTWVSEIIKDVNKVVDKEEIPSERLRFDKLQFLAKADNPDRYGGNKKVDVNFDLGKFKLLPPQEALEALKNDPFAIEAEFIPKDEDLL